MEMYGKGAERSEKVGKGEASWCLRYIGRLVEGFGLLGVSHQLAR